MTFLVSKVRNSVTSRNTAPGTVACFIFQLFFLIGLLFEIGVGFRL